jgi:transposase
MIGMDKIEDIRRRGRRGQSVASIARETGVSEPTVRKYLRMEDLSPEMPKKGPSESGLLAPYAREIDAWLDGDMRNWHKQRHTATKVYDRLREEHGYEGSYSTVQRYVKKRREEMAEERGRRDAQGYLELSWLAGECQVDFGEADFRVRGVVTRGKYLTVTFPHSNVGLTQVFWGETSECVCQGLRNVFEFVGGVPPRAVFDNATEVGRRFGSEIRVSELFRRFAAHYGLDYSFTNPYSGNEKGNVENKVGAHRRNLFVPIPAFSDVEAFNGRLLEACMALSEGKVPTGSAGPNPSSSQRTGRPSRRCRLPGSPASGGRRGNAAGRAPSRSAASTATPPALPTRAARSPSRSAPSASPSATAGPARPSRHTGGSGAGHRRTARIPCSS